MEIPASMKMDYLNRRKSDFKILAEALSEKDVEPFKRIGHQLAGNARSYGFNELEDIGRQMEKLSADSLSTNGDELLQKFNHLIETYKV